MISPTAIPSTALETSSSQSVGAKAPPKPPMTYRMSPAARTDFLDTRFVSRLEIKVNGMINNACRVLINLIEVSLASGKASEIEPSAGDIVAPALNCDQ